MLHCLLVRGAEARDVHNRLNSDRHHVGHVGGAKVIHGRGSEYEHKTSLTSQTSPHTSQTASCLEPSLPTLHLRTPALPSSLLQGARAQLICMKGCVGTWLERVYHFSLHSLVSITDDIPPLPASLPPIHTKYSHVVITETLANIYIKVDSIPSEEQEKFAHFSLLGVQFLTHHHWMEETIICTSFLTPCLLLHPL